MWPLPVTACRTQTSTAPVKLSHGILSLKTGVAPLPRTARCSEQESTMTKASPMRHAPPGRKKGVSEDLVLQGQKVQPTSQDTILVSPLEDSGEKAQHSGPGPCGSLHPTSFKRKQRHRKQCHCACDRQNRMGDQSVPPRPQSEAESGSRL